jgi:NAD+ kinase
MKKYAAIISKPSQPRVRTVAPSLLKWLRQHGYKVVVDRETARYVSGVPSTDRERIAARKPGFVLVLGGDGTMLSAARAAAKAGIPILGVNLGSLGFLTEVPLDDLYPTLEALDKNQCAVETRTMVRCVLVRKGKRIAEYHAFNDAVLSKTHIARISEYDVFIEQAFVANYQADGIIVATPTGSTAYSLSAGGSIVSPDAEVLLVTPVSPHTLTNRPLVVPDTSEISIVVKAGKGEAFLSVDGQIGTPLLTDDRVLCHKSEHVVRLLRLSNRTFFDVLRTKLKWGQR